MPTPPDLLRPLLTLLNLAIVGGVLALFTLLFGSSIAASYRQHVVAPPKAPRQNTLTIDPKVRNGIHLPTGLVFAKGFTEVRGNCTACHSAKLITQHRATRAGWEEMIRWMQARQGLHDLGSSEPIILDYLAQHYAPEAVGRRAGLDPEAIEWYILEL